MELHGGWLLNPTQIQSCLSFVLKRTMSIETSCSIIHFSSLSIYTLHVRSPFTANIKCPTFHRHTMLLHCHLLLYPCLSIQMTSEMMNVVVSSPLHSGRRGINVKPPESHPTLQQHTHNDHSMRIPTTPHSSFTLSV